MALNFYPHSDNIDKGTLLQRIEVLLDAAERYKAIVLEVTSAKVETTDDEGRPRRMIPRDLTAAFSWEEIARVLRSIRDMQESTKSDRALKAELLTSLAEIYEVLRGAKMSKLEAVRLALISEANQLRGGTQVA